MSDDSQPVFTDAPYRVVNNTLHCDMFWGEQSENIFENLKNVMLLADVDIDAGSIDNEFHFQQLIKCTAFFDSGLEIGPIIDVVHIPGQDLLVIEHEGREVMVPFVKEIVPIVDVINKKVIVTEKEGLLDA